MRDYDANPSWVKVTTITITSSFNQLTPVDVVRKWFQEHGELAIKPKQTRHRFIWKLSETTFYNQVSIYCDDHRSRKSVKLFPNGSIQVAGCCDMIDCERVLKQINCVIGHITKMQVDAHDYTVHMINSNFSLNKYVNLHKIFSTFEQAGHDVTFNPDRYSAVKIKMKPFPTGNRTVTVSMFNSGKIIVTGAKALAEVSTAYGMILDCIFSKPHEILGQDSPQVDVFQIWRGAPVGGWLEKFS